MDIPELLSTHASSTRCPLRTSSLSSRRLRRSANGNDSAQFVLPFLASPEPAFEEGRQDSGSTGEPGETLVVNEPIRMEDPATPEPMQPSARRHLNRNAVPPRRPNTKTKHSSLAPKRPPATASNADMISASTNLIALVEKRSGAWSAPELAELLGCTGKHIYALAKSGRLPHLRIGSMIRFDPAATAEWLRNRFIAA